MWVRKILSRMKRGGDGEHQIVLNRLAISCLIQAYLIGSYLYGTLTLHRMLVLSGVCDSFLAGGIVVAVALVLFPSPSAIRRIGQMFWDFIFLSLGMHLGDVAVVPLYPIYLWAILGYGFRFGLGYLAGAACVGAASFAIAVHGLTMWRDTGYLFAGLVGGLLIIPLYSASLIRFLSQTRRRAEEASRAKTLFLASVSHELRTPLNAVIGMSRLLDDMVLNAEQRDMVRTIGEAGSSLLGMIEDLLDFSRIEEGRMPVRLHPFDLLAVLREVERIVGVDARAKGLTLACHVTARTPVRLEGDERHLRDILLNLAGNAVKFTEHGHVVIAVDGTPLRDGGTSLRVEVSDTGIGISPAAQARVFETFTQADDTVMDRFGGTGLGLAICRQLVDLLGGEIGVSSVVGAGSVFWFVMPMKPVAPSSLPGSPERLPAGPWPDIVLLTSREDGQAGSVARLARHGVRVVVATTGAAAAALMRRPDCRSVLLTDMTAGDASDADASDADGAPFPTILLDRDAGAGLPPETLRCRFVSILSPEADDAALSSVLTIVDGLLPPREDGRVVDGGMGAGGAERSLNILLVEDNPVNQKVLGKILDRAGHRWRVAGNGEDALDMLEQEPFDLVLMDINMPVMNGIEATKLYRFSEVGGGPALPIVALTADGTPEARQRCRDAGMSGFLLKPVEIDALLETIDALAPPEAGQRRPRPAGIDLPVADMPTDLPADETVVVPFPAATINRKMVQDLQTLGGDRFRAEVIGEFLTDADAIIDRMDRALEAGDRAGLLDEAHALRSAAGNVGAERLAALCHEWRGIGGHVAPDRTLGHLHAVRQEMGKVRDALTPYTVLQAEDGNAGTPR
ncbi:signal transduction histidine kinase [Gluconacetobacter johannae DSM 13595]|uniref:histidine kinase n=1 Tax=Gluconacetobacter johannae TaxID=112140 RepID=A0A7W4J679_9PROT|nr:ATP-binding protein [Gluconacetobacter johannae]MBB2175465.1 response regulator [Gluconacetobacter johannae]GBQ88990.1 signal transduction histidine kinase [Gluconacetobacter johannae DSM 13595]